MEVVDLPRQWRREEIEVASKLIENREKNCVNCVYAQPNPYANCSLWVVCMRKPPPKSNSVWQLSSYSALIRSRDVCRNDKCRKFVQRKSPELFLRQLVWIKRCIWFLYECALKIAECKASAVDKEFMNLGRQPKKSFKIHQQTSRQNQHLEHPPDS